MKLAGLGLRQRDGVTCGPTVAVVAGALMDPSRREALTDPAWFAAEQTRVHLEINRVWPRRLGATPWGMTRALSAPSARFGMRYRWRLFRGRRDRLADVRWAIADGWPVAMLLGRFVPRHWVLIVDTGDTGDTADGAFECYEPGVGRRARRAPRQRPARPGAGPRIPATVRVRRPSFERMIEQWAS